MGHNSVVSGHSKSTGIPRVDGLSTGPPDLGCHTFLGSKFIYTLPCPSSIMDINFGCSISFGAKSRLKFHFLDCFNVKPVKF